MFDKTSWLVLQQARDAKAEANWQRYLSTRPSTRLKELRAVEIVYRRAGRPVDAVRDAADDVRLGLWAGTWTLGRELGFSLADYGEVFRLTGEHPRTIAPMNASPAEREAFRLKNLKPQRTMQKRDRRRARSRAKAEWMAQWGDLSDRAEVVYTVIPEQGEATVAQIKAVVQRHPLFRKLTGRSLDRAIQKELAGLEKANRLRARKAYPEAGPPMCLFRKCLQAPAPRHL
jgi:hypothetical protein